MTDTATEREGGEEEEFQTPQAAKTTQVDNIWLDQQDDVHTLTSRRENERSEDRSQTRTDYPVQTSFFAPIARLTRAGLMYRRALDLKENRFCTIAFVLEHSFANVSEAWKGHVRGERNSTLASPLRSYSPRRTSISGRNEFFESITMAVVQLFQRKKLQEGELSTLQDKVRYLVKTEAGPLIYDYYKDKLMKKGMVLLREDMKNDTGEELLEKIENVWNYLHGEILPVLQALLFPIKTIDMSIKQVTLLEFRNIVLMKVPFAESVESVNCKVSPAIEQMLLLVQSIPESPCTDNYFKMEKLLARVMSPYLGLWGLYMDGNSEPVVKSNYKNPPKILIIDESEEQVVEQIKDDPKPMISRLTMFHQQHQQHLNCPSTGLQSKHFLLTVNEQDSKRRHSIDGT